MLSPEIHPNFLRYYKRYDIYVDPENGDDLYSGTSPGSAKRTLEAALTLEGERICLLPGVPCPAASVPSDSSSISPEFRNHRLFIFPWCIGHPVLRFLHLSGNMN